MSWTRNSNLISFSQLHELLLIPRLLIRMQDERKLPISLFNFRLTRRHRHPEYLVRIEVSHLVIELRHFVSQKNENSPSQDDDEFDEEILRSAPGLRVLQQNFLPQASRTLARSTFYIRIFKTKDMCTLGWTYVGFTRPEHMFSRKIDKRFLTFFLFARPIIYRRRYEH